MWATLSAFTMLYFVDDGRHLVLMVYLTAMMFGASRLDAGEYLLVTLSALLAYAVVIAGLDMMHPEVIDVLAEALNWLVFFIVMVSFSLLGAEASRLRAALKLRNRELGAARDAAAVAYQAKSRFLATTSHELRTPLNMILGATDVIDERRLDGQQHDALARARRAGAHLLALINSMIDLSKLDSGALQLRTETLDLSERLHELRAIMAPLAAARGIELALEVDDALPRLVEGDGTRLNEVLVQLLNNAVKFTESGEVRLSARRETTGGTRIRFTVADTGCGMDARQLARVFAPFTPGDAASTRAHAGTGLGLGLALCQQLVDLMGGRLDAASSPGQGSRFSFAVPLPEAMTTPPTAATRSGTSLSRLRVLVVDDSPDNRMLMQAFLSGSVGKLTEAENGRVALTEFEAQRYDVVLMDMHMPVMDGIEATRAMRALESRGDGSHRVRILALTADDTDADRQRSLDAGCDDHLVKPISKKALLAALASHA